MITIIHGDDIVSSRAAILELKKKKRVSLTFEAKTLDLTKIKQEFEGGGLLEEERLVVIENLLSSTPPVDILSYFTKEGLPFDLVLWEEKELNPPFLKNFPQAQILLFKLKPIIFTFLDNLRPGNQKLMIKLFRETLRTTEVEMVFYMLVRQFRLLLAVAEKEKIEEVKKLAPWQLEKLRRQATLIGREKLILLYQKLFGIELSQKTGQTPLSLVASLDLFLLEI